MAVIAEFELSERLRAYLEAWNALDPATVAGRYTDDATHRGPGVIQMYPDRSDATVHGAAEIGDFAGRSRELAGGAPAFDYVIIGVLEGPSTTAVEYELQPMGMFAAEIITWDGDRARQVHVYWLRPFG